jgi:hypothetical protein
MTISEYHQLIQVFLALNVKKVIFKALSENDNTKQQIYLGDSFESINQIPFMEITTGNEEGEPNFKATLDFHWINENGDVALAPHSKLILYPKYPEVRLSGFLLGCKIAPSKHLQPIPKKMRTGNDGRFMFLGITDSGRIYAHLAPAGSSLSESIKSSGLLDTLPIGVFYSLPLNRQDNSKSVLLNELTRIHRMGWHESRRLDKTGKVIQYNARNGGGYTLEALLNIIPNGISEPDFMGWELKAFSDSRITLMTPEPDGGFYGENGVEAFVRKFGHKTGDDVIYFTGTHRVNEKSKASSMTLILDGFDFERGLITNVTGVIVLLSDTGLISAKWSFIRLLEHWARKHSQAAYIKYKKQTKNEKFLYHYQSPVWLGEGTDFSMFLKAMNNGSVIYDPAPKVTDASTLKPKTKARSQFRISFNHLDKLYNQFTEHIL